MTYVESIEILVFLWLSLVECEEKVICQYNKDSFLFPMLFCVKLNQEIQFKAKWLYFSQPFDS